MHTIDMDPEVAAVIITGIISFLVSLITSSIQSHSQMSNVERELTQTLADERHRVGSLHEDLIQVEDQLHDEHRRSVELNDSLEAALSYARALGHYMDQVCDKFGTFQGISKPHLPESIRKQIEHTSHRYGWDINSKGMKND